MLGSTEGPQTLDCQDRAVLGDQDLTADCVSLLCTVLESLHPTAWLQHARTASQG